MILELHLIQNFAPSNLNRSDTGAPKDCTFGGVRRARISSQCFKRAMREEFARSELIPPDRRALRSKRLHQELLETLREDRFDDDTFAVEALLMLCGIFLVEEKIGNSDEETPNEAWHSAKSEVLAFLGRDTINEFAILIKNNLEKTKAAGQVAKDHREKKRKDKKYDGSISKDDKKALRTKVKKALGNEIAGLFEKALDGSRAADLALFGRMLADLPEKNVDASSQVAHLISTHKVGLEFDFYTAVDDLKPEDTAGADMLGTVEFNSACFYRYANVNIDKLRENLQKDEELTEATVTAYIRAMVEALPTGKQNSFATHEKPSLVFAVVRKAGMMSLANAFEKPVYSREGGLVDKSIEALAEHYSNVTGVYGDGAKSRVFISTGDAEKAAALGDNVGTFDTLLDRTMSAIFGRKEA